MSLTMNVSVSQYERIVATPITYDGKSWVEVAVRSLRDDVGQSGAFNLFAPSREGCERIAAAINAAYQPAETHPAEQAMAAE